MATHDPLCSFEKDHLGIVAWCECDLIARVVERERERVADTTLDIGAYKREWLADLRAKVVAAKSADWGTVEKSAVLALIDGILQD